MTDTSNENLPSAKTAFSRLKNMLGMGRQQKGDIDHVDILSIANDETLSVDERMKRMAAKGDEATSSSNRDIKFGRRRKK